MAFDPQQERLRVQKVLGAVQLHPSCRLHGDGELNCGVCVHAIRARERPTCLLPGRDRSAQPHHVRVPLRSEI
eukprot:scaffold1596_cov302-Pinguiococcus_pyrenoidosus.AAC.8